MSYREALSDPLQRQVNGGSEKVNIFRTALLLRVCSGVGSKAGVGVMAEAHPLSFLSLPEISEHTEHPGKLPEQKEKKGKKQLRKQWLQAVYRNPFSLGTGSQC